MPTRRSGEFIAWIIGWDLILEYALGAATVAVGWSGNLITLLGQLGLSFPAALSAAPGTVVQVAGGDPVTAVFNLPAVLITVAVTLLLIVGVSESATVNSVIVVIKVAVVLVVIGAGAMFIDPANWHPLHPGEHRDVRRVRVERDPARSAGVIFFAYIGFDAVSTSAQEARNPQRDMPRGILGSLAVCTVLYVLVSGGDGRHRPLPRHAQPAGAARGRDRGRRRARRRDAVAGPRWRWSRCW